MSDNTTPAAHLQAASEAVRQHNHSAVNGGYTSTPEASRAAVALVEMCQRTRQALDHMGARVQRDLAAGVLAPDDRTAPEVHAHGAELALLDAGAALAVLLGYLQEASGHLWHLGMTYIPEEPDA
ncbi:hypothetical protein OG422_05830 [Streptomyces sp. NBC_01525]|uniref:hypothetical protein n=1 Tax=Streptomyces sp. NBC_01525 TaxID=2903893 RepID=UPI003862F338